MSPPTVAWTLHRTGPDRPVRVTKFTHLRNFYLNVFTGDLTHALDRGRIWTIPRHNAGIFFISDHVLVLVFFFFFFSEDGDRYDTVRFPPVETTPVKRNRTYFTDQSHDFQLSYGKKRTNVNNEFLTDLLVVSKMTDFHGSVV